MQARRDERLEDKTALVTGTSSGIGLENAARLGDESAAVAVNYHSDEEGAHEAMSYTERAGRLAVVVQGDISSEEDIRRLVRETENSLGPPDVY